MTKDDVIKFVEQQDKNLEFWKKEVDRLRGVINDINSLGKKEWIKPSDMNLSPSGYSAEEIETAFFKAKQYEGLVTNEHTTVLDTFVEFLKGTHHSLNKESNDKTGSN